MDDVIDRDLLTPEFSIRTAYYLACASECAYEDAGDWAEKLGLDRNVRPFTCGQLHGFVGFLDRGTLLAFRGTQSVGNCLTDLETPLVSRPEYPGRVHLGFAEAVDEVWPEARTLLGDPARTKPLWITGHSLGAAMATLASFRLAGDGYKIRGVYTYGSPRVGDRVFRSFYRLANYRFVNHNDLVPHLPFRWCYKHVGHLKLLDHEGHLKEEQKAWRKRKRAMARNAKRVQRAHLRRVHSHHEFAEFDWLADHHLDRYLEALRRILSRELRLRRMDSPVGGRGLHLHPRRTEPIAPAPSLVSADPGQRRSPVISEAEFIAAVFRQSPDFSWQSASCRGERR